MTTRVNLVAQSLGAALLAAAATAPSPALAAPLAACAGVPGEVRLQIAVQGVRDGRGGIVLTLYPDDSQRFLASKGKIGKLSVPARAGTTRACIAAPGPGGYALAVYHDEDGDGKLGRSFIGLPSEGWGFSNDAPAKLALPRFQDARFVARDGDNPLTLTLRY